MEQSKREQLYLEVVNMSQLNKATGIILLIFQVILIIGFAIFIPQDEGSPNNPKTDRLHRKFETLQLMTVIGFGLLILVLKHYAYSGIGFNFLLDTIIFQYGILCSRIFKPIKIDMEQLVETEIMIVAILITKGATLGVATPLQMFLMALIEVPIFLGNSLLMEKLQVVDSCGSVHVHLFAACFGVSASKILITPMYSHLETSSYHHDIFSLIGTLLLWVFWPSLNGSISKTHSGAERGEINTFLALLASGSASFSVSSLVNKGHKFRMLHIQNATIAGAISIGAIADLKLSPWMPLTIGGIAGSLSTLGFRYVNPWVRKNLGFFDSGGISCLHGVASVISGLAAAIIAAGATEELYGDELYDFFPAMGMGESGGIFVNKNRTAGQQACYQLLYVLFTLTIAVTGGIVTGIVLKITSPYIGISEEQRCNDECFWETEKDYVIENYYRK